MPAARGNQAPILQLWFFFAAIIVAVEIGAPLLEFGEVLDRFECALRAKPPLNEHASQSRGSDAMAGLRWTSIGRKVRGLVGMAVCVAIEARHAPARLFRTAILGLVELLLRKWREVQFDLVGSK